MFVGDRPFLCHVGWVSGIRRSCLQGELHFMRLHPSLDAGKIRLRQNIKRIRVPREGLCVPMRIFSCVKIVLVTQLVA